MGTDNSEQIEAACVEMTTLLIDSWFRTDQDAEYRPLAIQIPGGPLPAQPAA